MFVCVCSLCVDTLWHVKFTQPSALISRAQDEVEQVANKFCAENTAMGSLTLSAADKTALEAFAGCAAAGEVGGVTLKKFSANAAKKCIVAEYIVGGGGAKKESVSASGFVPHHLAQSHFSDQQAPGSAKDAPKKNAGVPAAAAKKSVASAHDNVPAVSQQLIQDLLSALKAEGVSIRFHMPPVPHPVLRAACHFVGARVFMCAHMAYQRVHHHDEG